MHLFGFVHGDAVVQLVHGLGRAAADTGGILTVVAQRGNVMVADVGKRPRGLGDFVGPVNPLRDVVFAAAGEAAGTASDATLQVDDHGISGHLISS